MNKPTSQTSPITLYLSTDESIEHCWTLVDQIVAETTDEELECTITTVVDALPWILDIDNKGFVIGIDVEAVRRAFREKRERDRADRELRRADAGKR